VEAALLPVATGVRAGAGRPDSSPAPDLRRVLTDRLLLRQPSASDADAVFEIHGDPRANVHNPAGPDRTPRESASKLRRWLDHWKDHGFGYWAAEERCRPGDVIGFGGLRLREIEGRTRPNLYFRLAPSAWGRGLGTELGRAALEVAFGALGFEEVVATVRPDNAPSIRVLERLGLEPRTRLTDGGGPTLLYARTRTP
jgi:ribosomal-protein-alanine N-acetyltransferase